MGMRKGVPHAKCSPLCAIKEKLQELWDRAYGCINKINDITPDGDGKFSIQAGSNIQLTEISNGLKIDTTGGVTYYTTTDPKLDIDNDALTIETVGVASQDDLDTVAGGVTTNANAISDIVDGTTTVSKANTAYGITRTIGDCIATVSEGYALTNAGSQIIKLDTINNAADYSITNNVITIKNAGHYLFIASVRFSRAQVATGNYSRMRIVLNNTEIASSDESVRSDITMHNVAERYAIANSTVNLETYWASADTLSVSEDAPATFLQIIRLAW